MDSTDTFRERFEAVRQRTEQLQQHTSTVERRQGWWCITWRVAAVASLGLALAHPYPAQAKTFHCGAGDVPCLIAAINEANANGTKNTIRLEAGTYTLTTAYNESAPTPLRNGLPEVTSALTLIGAGADSTSIESDASIPLFSRFFRILSVTATGTLTLEGLTIRGGFLGGPVGSGAGGIDNSGSLTIHTSRITGNVADGGGGWHWQRRHAGDHA